MGKAGMMDEVEGKGGLILVLNSGSSSLKFGVYCRSTNDEEALLSGSAEGIGRDSGRFNVLSADGTLLAQKNSTHETQPQALQALAEAMREHISAAPAAVGHRVVHGGPRLTTHQIITPKLIEELRGAIHF